MWIVSYTEQGLRGKKTKETAKFKTRKEAQDFADSLEEDEAVYNIDVYSESFNDKTSRAGKILESLKGKTKRFQEANNEELSKNSVEDIQYRLQKLLNARLTYKGQINIKDENFYTVYFSSAELNDKQWTGVSVFAVLDREEELVGISELKWVTSEDKTGTLVKGFKSFLVRAD